METVQNKDVQEPNQGRVRLFIGQLSWRMILMRLVINGLTLILVAVLVPDIYFVDRTLLSVLLMAATLGILNAFVKPIVQFLTLPFIFATYGFVVVLINTIILILLAIIFEERFFVGRLIWAIVGGLVMGIVSSFLESLLGLNLPIAPKSELPNRGETMPGPGTRIFTSMLAEDATGEEAMISRTELSEPVEVEPSPEPSVPATEVMTEDISGPMVDERPVLAQEGAPSVAEEDADNKQQGDEQ